MDLQSMKEGLTYIDKIVIEENEDYKIYCDLFSNVGLGDIGTVKIIKNDELKHCEDKEHRDTLSLINKFCVIPYPDDIEHECGEDYLIFMRYQLDGTRGKESNVVFDCKYFIDFVKRDYTVNFEVEK